MFKKQSFIILLFCFSKNYAQLQDSIFLMNGHVVSSAVIDTTHGTVNILNPKKADRIIKYEIDQLFLVKYSAGFSRYYYSQDSLVNNWLSRDEMWFYMKGETDARKGFKARGAMIGATLAGVAGGMTGSFWGPIAPYGFMALSGLPKIKIKHKTVSDLELLKSVAYLMGYERVARQRLKTRSLIGGTAGLFLGYTIYALTNQHYPESVNIGFNK